jgi:hypothetical protein
MTVSPGSGVHLDVVSVHPDQIDQAYGSLLLDGLHMTLPTWRHYAKARIEADASKAGLMSIQCDRSYIHGLFGYEISPIGVDRHMTIDLFIACDQIGDRIARTMVEAIDNIAFDHACSAIHIDSQDFRSAKIIVLEPRSLSVLCEQGYGICSIQFSRKGYPSPQT